MSQLEQIESERGSEPVSAPAIDPLARVRDMVSSCIQCGTCTGSCPNAFAMDLTPRQLWYNVLRGEKETIFHSKTFTLCSVCYYCTLRCPRGLPLTEAMSALKQISVKENPALYKMSIRFYQNFLESVRRHGRVREMEFMTLFFLSMLNNPFLPLKFTWLGMRLMAKGKVSPEIPKGGSAFEALFHKVEELEKN